VQGVNNLLLFVCALTHTLELYHISDLTKELYEHEKSISPNIKKEGEKEEKQGEKEEEKEEQ
jgi:hypothetical protein